MSRKKGSKSRRFNTASTPASAATPASGAEKKLSVEEFVLKAIGDLNDPKYGKGIHVVITGFNKAFEKYFGFKSREYLDKLVEKGVIELRMRRGGPMIYKPGDAPSESESADKKGEEALQRILHGDKPVKSSDKS